MDKKTSKSIDEAVSRIKMDIWHQSVAITEDVQREIETRLIQTIHDRWEYMDRKKVKKYEKEMENIEKTLAETAPHG